MSMLVLPTKDIESIKYTHHKDDGIINIVVSNIVEKVGVRHKVHLAGISI